MAGQALRECFVIAPIGGQSSSIRRATDNLLDQVIQPTLQEFGIEMSVAHRLSRSGSITRQVIGKLLSCELVVANLTGLNPNVMYELALRHAKRLPVVSLAEEGTQLPFDIVGERTVFYVNEMGGAEELKPLFAKAVREALAEEAPDNPVYRAVQGMVMREVAANDTQSYLLERLDTIEHHLATGARRSGTANSRQEMSTLRNFDLAVSGRPQDIEDFRDLLDSSSGVDGFATNQVGHTEGETDVAFGLRRPISLGDLADALRSTGLRVSSMRAHSLPSSADRSARAPGRWDYGGQRL